MGNVVQVHNWKWKDEAKRDSRARSDGGQVEAEGMLAAVTTVVVHHTERKRNHQLGWLNQEYAINEKQTKI